MIRPTYFGIVGVLASFAAIVVVNIAPDAAGADLAITGYADGDTRWFEMYSDAFVQLDKGFHDDPQKDGFFLVLGGTPTPQQLNDFDPKTFAPTFNAVGSGVDAFPNDENFQLGTISYNNGGLTGSGFESAPITAYTVNFADNIADNDALSDEPYLTTIDSVSGSVKFRNGQLIGVYMNAAVTFTYDYSIFGGDVLPYSGAFKIRGDEFELFVDGTHPTSASPLRYIWESTGFIDQVTPLPGDYDRDLDVDADDYTVWRQKFGSAVLPAGRSADGNNNGFVDAADYVVWRKNLGLDSGLSTGAMMIAVPEPAAWSMALMTIVASVLFSRELVCCFTRHRFTTL